MTCDPCHLEFPEDVMPAASRKKQKPQKNNASEMIDKRIEELDDWRGKMLAHIRKVIKQADADVVEEWKWSNPFGLTTA